MYSYSFAAELFIPVAEDMGMIAKISQQTMKDYGVRKSKITYEVTERMLIGRR